MSRFTLSHWHARVASVIASTGYAVTLQVKAHGQWVSYTFHASELEWAALVDGADWDDAQQDERLDAYDRGETPPPFVSLYEERLTVILARHLALEGE